MGAMAAFRQIMLDAQWHREVLAWSQRHPESDRPPIDQNLEALWALLDGKVPVIFIANKENEIHRALDMAEEFGWRPIITGAREGWKVKERLRDENVPVILSVDWPEDPTKKYKSKKKGKEKGN
ncbi:MAG: hypothetical protein IH859_00735 [Chloroflexi bacterium]|nr:hypothetical protein [Chloroflexota bacterium]